MAIVEELKKIGGGTGSTIEEAIASGDFSGGGVFLITMTEQPHEPEDSFNLELDKTWNEIHDAMLSGKNCVVVGTSPSISDSSFTSTILNLDDLSIAEYPPEKPYIATFMVQRNQFSFIADGPRSPLLMRVEI